MDLQCTQFDNFERLPQVLIASISSFADSKSLARFEQTCKRLRKMPKLDKCWKRCYFEQWKTNLPWLSLSWSVCDDRKGQNAQQLSWRQRFVNRKATEQNWRSGTRKAARCIDVAGEIALMDVSNGFGAFESTQRVICLVDLAKGKTIRTCSAPEDLVEVKLESNRSPALLAAAGKSQLFVWDAGTGSRVLQLNLKRGRSLALGGEWLAVLSKTNEVHLLNLTTGEFVYKLLLTGTGQELQFNDAADQLFVLSSAQFTVWSLGPAKAVCLKRETFTHSPSTRVLFDRKCQQPLFADQTKWTAEERTSSCANRVDTGADLTAFCADDLVVAAYPDALALMERSEVSPREFCLKRLLHKLNKTRTRGLDHMCADNRFAVCNFDDGKVIVFDFGA